MTRKFSPVLLFDASFPLSAPWRMCIALRVVTCHQYPGCSKAPTYGHVDEPRSFCNGHKKAGMHTSRKGVIVVATRDGDGKEKATSFVVDVSHGPCKVSVVRTSSLYRLIYFPPVSSTKMEPFKRLVVRRSACCLWCCHSIPWDDRERRGPHRKFSTPMFGISVSVRCLGLVLVLG